MDRKRSDWFTTWMWAYLSFSLVVACLVPNGLTSSLITEASSRIPTVNTLAGYAPGNEYIRAYFLAMTFVLPISVYAFYGSYEGRSTLTALSWSRILYSATFLLAAMALLSWFAFFLPPDRNYTGTRMRVLIALSANSRIALGLIFGIIFSCLSMTVCVVYALFQASITKHVEPAH